MLLDVISIVSIAFFGVATCQSSTTTSSAPGATHTVSVGADGLNFTPNQVYANKGDIIEYRFYPQNHSVARAAFGNEPCIPYELTGPGRVGFWSGFNPIALVLSNPPIWRLVVNDTEPIFFYCSSPGACLKGMVGVINPNSTFTYAQQFNYTQNATLDFSPGEYFPKESRPSRTTTAPGATFTPTPVSSTPTSSAPIEAGTTVITVPLPTHPHNSSKPSLGAGPIAGIVLGAIAVVALASALLYMCGRRQSVKELLQHQHQASSQPPPNHSSYQPSASGMSEAQYPNMQKTPIVAEGRWVGAGTETESYRSLSPPGNERMGMIGMQNRGGRMTPQGQPSPHVGVQGFQPTPAYYSSLERENMQKSAGLRPYNPAPKANQTGPHELASPDETRPFSYTDSESGYVLPSDRDVLPKKS